MLSRISYESLKKAAIYGAVLSVSGCSILYYLIQRKMYSFPSFLLKVQNRSHVHKVRAAFLVPKQPGNEAGEVCSLIPRPCLGMRLIVYVH